MTDLALRMKLHTPGQVTWPEPELRRFCDACDHYSTAGIKAPDKGRCKMVAAHQNVAGKIFGGGEATACPLFREKSND